MTPTKPHIQGVAIGLSITLVACTAAHRAAAPLDVDRLCRAIGHIESGNRNLKPRWDVNGVATGVYQFHLPRWLELGGTRANFGKASVALQTKLLRAALAKRKCTTFEQVARWHNGAGKAHYKYAEKLEATYKGIK